MLSGQAPPSTNLSLEKRIDAIVHDSMGMVVKICMLKLGSPCTNANNCKDTKTKNVSVMYLAGAGGGGYSRLVGYLAATRRDTHKHTHLPKKISVFVE